MDKIELIEQAIKNADEMKSGLSPEVFDEVPALVSLKGRHLYNNLGKLCTIHCHAGVHLGGSYCSVVYGNNNIKAATAIDSFESDKFEERKCEPIFKKNAHKFTPASCELKIIVSDSFDDSILKEAIKEIDFYVFDCSHSEEDQRKALTHYLPILADEFIYVCDDYDWPEVKKGTQDGIKECNLEILYEAYLPGNDHDNLGYWNGYYISLLRKK